MIYHCCGLLFASKLPTFGRFDNIRWVSLRAYVIQGIIIVNGTAYVQLLWIVLRQFTTKYSNALHQFECNHHKYEVVNWWTNLNFKCWTNRLHCIYMHMINEHVALIVCLGCSQVCFGYSISNCAFKPDTSEDRQYHE